MTARVVSAGQRITGVRRAPGDATRVVVFVGGARAGVIGAGEAERLGVRRGAELSPATADALAAAIAQGAARRDLERLVRGRARTRAELIDRLAARGHDRSAAERAVDSLARVGAVDDRAVAEGVAIGLAEKRVSRGLAEERLVRRGVEPGEAARAVERAFDGRDDLSAAIEAAGRRVRAMGKVDGAAARRRLAGFLARRGYDEETTEAAVRAVLGEGGDEVG